MSSAGDAMVKMAEGLANVRGGQIPVTLKSSGPTPELADLEENMTPDQRAMVSKHLGIELPENMPMSRFKAIVPQIGNAFENAERAKERHELIAERRLSAQERQARSDRIYGRLPAKVDAELHQKRQTLRALDMLKAAAADKGAMSGPILSQINDNLRKIGLDDPRSSRFGAAAQGLINQHIKAITGAQMSEPEAQRITRELMTQYQSGDTFDILVKRYEDFARSDLANRIDALKQQSYSVPANYNVSGPSAGPARIVVEGQEFEATPEQLAQLDRDGVKYERR